MAKTPNLRQPSTGPTIYKPMVIPPVKQVPLAVDPNSYSRPGSWTPKCMSRSREPVRVSKVSPTASRMCGYP